MRRICRVTGLRKNLTFALILSSLFANERGVIKLPFNWRNCNNQRVRLAVGLDEDDMPELVEDLLTNILLLPLIPVYILIFLVAKNDLNGS